MKILTTEQVALLLAHVGRNAADDAIKNNHVAHPEDLAYAMTLAIESAASTLEALREQGHLSWETRL